MARPIDKFYGEQDSRHGSELAWNSRFLFPIRLSCIAEKTKLLDNVDLEQSFYLFGSFNAKIFDLSAQEEKEFYLWIKDRAINGWFTIAYQEYHWNEETKNMMVYLEWYQLYYQLKNQML